MPWVAAQVGSPPVRAHPLGAVLLRSDIDETRRVRAWSAVVLICSALLIGVLLYVTPAREGMGTHTQLGLPPCSWPGEFGIPCPTCGVTTSLAWFVRGRWIASAVAQPLGLLLGLLLLAGIVNGAIGLVSGRWWRINTFRVPVGWMAGAAGAAALAAWGYKLLAMRGAIG